MGRVIVALSGWAKSGKDTLANHLIDKKKAKKISFAEPLKARVSDDFNLSSDYMHNQDKKEVPLYDIPVEPKDQFSLMIAKYLVKEFRSWTGQIAETWFYGQTESSDEKKFLGILKDGKKVKLFWTPRAMMIVEGSTKRSIDCNFWVKKAIEKAEKNGLFVIADLRYKSELDGIANTINPEDKLITIRVNRFESTQSQDSSERDLDDATFDYVIENKGSLEEYMEKINNILNEIEIKNV